MWWDLHQSSFGTEPHSTAILVYGSFRSACISRAMMGEEFRNSYDSLLGIIDMVGHSGFYIPPHKCLGSLKLYLALI